MMKKSFIYNCIILSVFCVISGCDMFNQSLPDYLRFWTEVARTAKYEFDGSYPQRNGYTNLPSGADRLITYYLLNPQEYTLKAEVTFPGGITALAGTDYIIEQDVSDKALFYLTLCNHFLLPLDGDGAIITPVLNLTEPASMRDFGSYSIPIRINSPPPAVISPTVLRSGTVPETYVICFNVPDMSAASIHRDISELKISAPYERSYKIVNGILYGGAELQTEYNENWQPVVIAGEEDGGIFIGDKEHNFIGIVTDIPLSDKQTIFDLTLTDKYGLSQTIQASSRAPKLPLASANPVSNSTIRVTESVTVTAPVPEATLFVSCTPSDGVTFSGEPVEGAESGWLGSVDLLFEKKGRYNITARSEIVGAADSDEIIFTYTVVGPDVDIEIPGLGTVTLTVDIVKNSVIIGGLPDGAVITTVMIHGVSLSGGDGKYELPEGITPGTYPLSVSFDFGGIGYNGVVNMVIE